MPYFFILCAIVSVLAGEGEERPSNAGGYPSWIAGHPGFQHPEEVDSIKTGNGSVSLEEKKSVGWLVHLNQERGYGVEVDLEELDLDPDAGDFFMVAPWPPTSSFKEAKLFSGKFTKTSKVRIPNTKSFLILYTASATTEAPKMAVSYRRYGVSYEPTPPPTDVPIKKETIYEVQLKGKTTEEYFEPEFLNLVKEAMRATASRFCAARNIPFNDNIPTQEMVNVRRISFCPFEWPEREICSSIEHTIFVSGVRISEQHIKDYELTADHLREMWAEERFPELESLGITVYRLPTTASTALWWTLIIGLIVVSCLIVSFIFWRMVKYKNEISSRKSSAPFEPFRPKKKKLGLGKHQVIPPFMFSGNEVQFQEKMRAAAQQPGKEDGLSFRDPSGLPKEYFGSILFGSNRAFDEDEENVEFRRK